MKTSTSPPRVVTLTLNPSLEFSTSTPKVRPEERLRCLPAQFDAGGGGIHVSRVVAQACRRLHRSGVAEVVVVSLGQEGALLISSQGQWLGRPPRVEVQSAVGAGDGFVGAMTLALLRGDPHEVALAWASAAGSAALMTPGSELCLRGDVERLRHQVKIEPIDRSSANWSEASPEPRLS